MLKIQLENTSFVLGGVGLGGGGLEVSSETTSPLSFIKTKAIKNDKGKEGVIKWEKWVNVVDG